MSTSGGRLEVRFGGRTDLAPRDLFAALRAAGEKPRPARVRTATGREAEISHA